MQHLTTCLQSLFEEFKNHHYLGIDLLEDEEDLAKEQEVYNAHEERHIKELVEFIKKKESHEGISNFYSVRTLCENLSQRELLILVAYGKQQ